ncbi:MAG: pantoate--beta-alanine ligase [Candidatus Omnitrophota bacterium]|jgi:pantoate--beta-alanine ligase
MKIIRSLNLMTKSAFIQKRGNKSVGFVPTMGALHEGHLSLIRQARRDNDIVVVSVFVNPSQFGPKEDFKIYPRPIKKDITLCRKEGVDFLFYPQERLMYPAGFRTYVTVEGLSSVLCGKSRPLHFRGVATVVLKLFNIIRPDIAYFGKKDFQQVTVIKRMVSDLNIPVKIKLMPIIREKSGLALSSRNNYLNKEEKKTALVLTRALHLADILIRGGLRDSKRLISRMKMLIEKEKRAKLDYAVIVNKANLEPVKKISANSIIALAVWVNKTRLIDNMEIRN